MAAPPAPIGWTGSAPEWNIFWALNTLGLKFEEDFFYQAAQAGGRLALGGVVLDFYLPNLSLAINVQSIWWHYATTRTRTADQLNRAMLEGLGIRIIYIDEDAALRDPVYYTREALQYRDHSRMTQ